MGISWPKTMATKISHLGLGIPTPPPYFENIPKKNECFPDPDFLNYNQIKSFHAADLLQHNAR